MSIYKTIIKRRTIRQFKQKKISLSILKRLINAARLAPSAANLQPLEFLVIDEEATKENIFKTLRFANYITPLWIPPQGKKPTAYIIVLINTKIARKEYVRYDVGASVENILLCAWEKKIGACWVKSFDANVLKDILKPPQEYEIDSVVALGYKDESPKIAPLKDSVKYYKDKKEILHVPKRSLDSLFHYNIF